MHTEAELERPIAHLRGRLGIKPGMGVFTTDRERVGAVDRTTDTLVHLSAADPSSNRYAHSFPTEWVDWVDGSHVYLNKPSGFVFRNWNGPTGSTATVVGRIMPYLQVYSSDDIRV